MQNLLINKKIFRCKLIAIGNGTACRETETWISNLISEKAFYPLDISYTIVNESGASIYSCSTEARKEFSDLNPNLISAGILIYLTTLQLVLKTAFNVK